VIIFDWDDTIMSSSYVDREKLIHIPSFSSLPTAMQAMFLKLEDHAMKCLRAAMELGTVIIITNAEAGWVEYSSKRFLPRLVPLLSQMRIASARSTYERFYPGSPLCWKAAAFAHEANVIFGGNYDSNTRTLGRQIISFGDSNEERTAVKIAAGQLNALAKSIKFVDLPSPDQLCKQIETVTGWLEWLTSSSTELDLMMKPSATEDLEPQDSSSLASVAVSDEVVDNSTSSSEAPYRPPAMSTLSEVS
jgi:hypothetical protein